MPLQPFLGAHLPALQVDAVEAGNKAFVDFVQNQHITVERRNHGGATLRVGWQLTLYDQVTDREHQAVITVAALEQLPADELRCELDEVYAVEVAHQMPEFSQGVCVLHRRSFRREPADLDEPGHRAADDLVPG